MQINEGAQFPLMVPEVLKECLSIRRTEMAGRQQVREARFNKGSQCRPHKGCSPSLASIDRGCGGITETQGRNEMGMQSVRGVGKFSGLRVQVWCGQPTADAPRPLEERFQGFASLENGCSMNLAGTVRLRCNCGGKLCRRSVSL